MAPADSLNSLYDENNDNMQLQSHPSVGGRESINWIYSFAAVVGWGSGLASRDEHPGWTKVKMRQEKQQVGGRGRTRHGSHSGG